MSSPDYAITPALFPTPKPVSFIAANGTTAKVLVETMAAAAAGALTPAFYGGGTVLDITASSTDTVSRDVVLWLGKVLATQDPALTGAITLSAQNTLSRATGSWISNGWQVGDVLMVFAPPNAAQTVAGIDGIAGTLTAVTAGALTVNGTPWASGTPVLAAGSRIVNVTQLHRTAVAANSGNVAGVPNVQLLRGVTGNTVNDSSIVATEQKLGADGMLIASMGTAVSALPAVVSITPRNTAAY